PPGEHADDAAFQDFTHRFAGWFKSHEINAPPDMTPVLGEDYENEQEGQLASGEISREQFQERMQWITDLREWEKRLRSEYQRDWRAEVARQFAWAKESGRMVASDHLAALQIENPHTPEDFEELLSSLERMAGEQRQAPVEREADPEQARRQALAD